MEETEVIGEYEKYRNDFLEKAEKEFTEWLGAETQNLDWSVMAIISKEVYRAKRYIGVAVSKAQTDLDKIMKTVEELKSFSPISEKQISFMEGTGKDFFEKAIGHSYDFWKNYLSELIRLNSKE